jgi:phage protein D
MLKVSYKITIGQTSYTAGDKSQLVDLRSHSGFDIPVNSCRIILGMAKNLTIALGEVISVELGYDTSQTLVFTGKVSSVDWGIERVSIYASGSFTKLTAARFNILFEKPTAGDIIKDIAQNRLKLPVDKIEDGLKFSVYTLGDRHPVYDHLKFLARQCGFDFYANTADKVVFAKYTAETTHECKYGQDILTYNLTQVDKNITGVEIYGESPASQGQGEQAYSWLTKKEVKGTAGSNSAMMLRLADPTARTQEVANKIAASVLQSLPQKPKGSLKVIGNPKIKLGDAVKISQMPISQQNGNFKITGIVHTLNRRSGFCTLINWEKV